MTTALRGSVQIGLRLDVATAELLQAAAAVEGLPRLATYLRLAVRTHVIQSKSIPPDLQNDLAARIGGPNLPAYVQQHTQSDSAEALPVVISDDAQL